MKVCFMLGNFSSNGGIGRVTSVLASRIAELDCGIDVVTLNYAKSNKPNIYNLSDIIEQRFFLEQSTSMSKTILCGGVKKLRKFLVDNNIDVVVACGALYYPICVNACKGIGTKCICWEHSSPYHSSDFKLQMMMRKYGIHRSDLNVVLTNDTKQVFINKFKAKNVIRIYNPIDNQVFAKKGTYLTDSNKIITVGRLSYQKYLEMAIEVAREVLKKYPDWSWDIYGTGELRDTLASLIQESGLEGKMNLMGQVSDLYDRYKNYSMLVMTSRYEGFPMTLLEGMGNGLPLVSFDIKTGPNEIIKDGANGFLIDAFDKDKMVERIVQLIEDKELRKSMSEMNLQISKNFSEESIVNEWVTVLKELAQTKKA